MVNQKLQTLMIFCSEFGQNSKLNFRIPKTRLWVDVFIDSDVLKSEQRRVQYGSTLRTCSWEYFSETGSRLEGLLKVRTICEVLSVWTPPQNFTFEHVPVFSWEYDKMINEQREYEAMQTLFNMIESPTRYLVIVEEFSVRGYYVLEKILSFIKYISKQIDSQKFLEIYSKKVLAIDRFDFLINRIEESEEYILSKVKKRRDAYLVYRLLKNKTPIGKIDDDILEAYNDLLELKFEIKETLKR